ncbi:flagellar biosynthesis protein FlgD [Bremerella cremea]|uniref:Basal-body rod modification protein FlgD n=1 Tax=Bremerella cremea TaxID=1031537 RepID=A0A368KN35_9BACT|nr:flagellar hook capping FlgD N-terminal domain-containing protein [Bremerella cremea]RCS41373.1 flagellar biosynthesis protein FlgD [Bremerella cremea]
MSSVDTSGSNNTTQGSSGTSGSSAAKYGSGINDLNMDEFLQLMIAELQNQDPLDPTKNSEMLQQIGQIREIGATDQLRASLDSMQQSQGISTASSLIGKQVQALTDDGYVLFGVVNSVQLTPNDDGTRELRLKVNTGDQTVDVKMDDIFTILPASAQAPAEPDPTDETDTGTEDTTDSESSTDDSNSGSDSVDETTT